MAETLYEKAMRLLGRPITKAVDPDDADSRVGDDAQPTDKKLEGAGEEAAAGGQAGAGAEGGVPGDPGAGAGEEAGGEGGEGGHSEPDGDEGKGAGAGDGDEGFDDHGNQDMGPDEIRELRKAFGLTDKEDLADIAKGTEIVPLLKSILAYMQKSDAYQQNLTKELAELKAKHASGKGDCCSKCTDGKHCGSCDCCGRHTMKSLDEKVDALQKTLDGLHKTIPAAAPPKALQKAVDTGAPGAPKLTLADVTALSLRGEISAAEAARLTRMINHNLTPAIAGN